MNDEWKLPNGSIIKFGDKKDEDYKGQEIDFSFLEPEQFEISEEGYKKMTYPPDPSTSSMRKNMKTAIPITAIWLRRIKSKVEVLAEINNKFYMVIRENIDANFSHIAEGNGRENWSEDYLYPYKEGE